MLELNLESEPAGMSRNVTYLLSRMKPMTIELFEEYWNMVNTTEPLLDWTNSNYSEWDWLQIPGNNWYQRVYGMKFNQSNNFK